MLRAAPTNIFLVKKLAIKSFKRGEDERLVAMLGEGRRGTNSATRIHSVMCFSDKDASPPPRDNRQTSMLENSLTRAYLPQRIQPILHAPVKVEERIAGEMTSSNSWKLEKEAFAALNEDR